jgi:hypothetical protein
VLSLATAGLLVLIAIDLAVIHTCALRLDEAPGPPHASVVALDGPGATSHQHAPLHPDHCFCHGLSTGASRALLAAPRRQAETVLESPPGHPLHAAAALYHPPQLPA